MRTCKKCEVAKPEEQFRIRQDRGGARRPTCRKCERTPLKPSSAEQRRKQARSARRTRLKTKFNLTEEQYSRMFYAQHGHCALCGSYPDANRLLAVDHCHKTNKIRALLCTRCNVGLGMLQDSPELLRAAAEYVERYQ